MTRQRQGGFTLVELMVVVAIIGVLAGMAAVMLNPQPRSDDAAQATAAMVREASRKAIERGTVREDVAAAVSSGAARTQLRISQDDGRITLTVDMLVEEVGSPSGMMVTIATRTLSRGVTIEGSTDRAVLDDGDTPEEPLLDGEEVVISCYPDGLCDGKTVYFRTRSNNLARVAILPLGGAPLTFKRW